MAGCATVKLSSPERRCRAWGRVGLAWTSGETAQNFAADAEIAAAAVGRLQGMRPALLLQPERVPFNGSVLGSTKGTWIISVTDAVFVEGTDNVLLNLILEKGVRAPEDLGLQRRLGMLVPAPVLKEFCLREGVACDIRQWLEATEGNGFLDLRAA